MVGEGMAPRDNAFIGAVDGGDGFIQVQVNAVFAVIAFGAQEEAFQIHLAQQVFFGQRRALIGRHGFFADQGDLALVPQGAQFGDAGRARLPGPDHDNSGHPVPFPFSWSRPRAEPISTHTGNAIDRQGATMSISKGDKLPDATLGQMGAEGPEQVALADKVKGRKVVIFAVPGAYTPTCHSAHVPSFVRTKDQFNAKGVDEIICVSVNDPFVMGAWGEATGASAAGITMLGDPESAFTKAIGMDFTAPPVGLIARSKRYAMVVEDGVVTALHEEENPGACDVSAGEALLEVV